MSAGSRILLFGLASLAILVALILRATGNEDTPTPGSSETSATRPGRTGPANPPPYIVIVEGGRTTGPVRELEFRKGDVIRFRVFADDRGKVRVDGYGHEEPVGVGREARFEFPAARAGVFSVDLDPDGVEILRLRVRP